MVVPFIKFLNLIVVFAAPRACFIILKFNTLYGSPSNSIVIPFLISDVSIATFNDVDEDRDTKALLLVLKILGQNAVVDDNVKVNKRPKNANRFKRDIIMVMNFYKYDGIAIE